MTRLHRPCLRMNPAGRRSVRPGAGACDQHPCSWTRSRQNFSHVIQLHRHAALRKLRCRIAQVKEDRAASPLPARMQIVVKYDQNVVEAVASPELFVGWRKGQLHQPVVSRMSGCIAPAVPFTDLPCWHGCTWWPHTVPSHAKRLHAKPANRRLAIAFPLCVGQSRPTQMAAKGSRANFNSANGCRLVDHKYSQIFDRHFPSLMLMPTRVIPRG
jgi:hypothetical protein